MAKKPTRGEQLEFAQLRAFVTTSFEDIASSLSLEPEDLPAAVADKLWTKSPGLALQGLRAAAADAVEMFQDLDGAALTALEGRLARAGAPSLSAMRDRRRREVFRILNRGRIQNDDEWRLINALVSDVDDLILDSSMRELSNALLGEYERRAQF